MPAQPSPDFVAFAQDRIGRLRAIAELLTGDTEAADALVVQSLAAVWRRWHQLRPPGDPDVGVRRLLTTAYLRSSRHVVDDGPALDLDDRWTTPEPSQERDEVWDALLDLSPRERSAVVWRHFAGLSDRDVARVLLTTPLLAARLHRRAVDQVGTTTRPFGVDAISDVRDTDLRARLETSITATLATHHRGDVDPADLLDRLRELTDAVTPRRIGPVKGLAAVAAALVTASVITVVARWPEGGSLHDVATFSLPDRPEPHASPGTRVVGYADIAVEIPVAWAHNELGCDASVTGSVIYPDAQLVSTCTGTAQIESSVEFGDSQDPNPPELTGLTPAGPQVAGHQTEVSQRRRTNGYFQQVVVVPDSHVTMLVRSRDPAVVAAVVDSLHTVPEGFTVVPVCRGERLRDVGALLVEAGLHLVITQSSTLSQEGGPPRVTHQSVAAGTLVPIDTDVGVGFPST